MTSPAPAPKRRRLDSTTSALHKPFRSPLKSAHQTPSNIPTTPARPLNPLNASRTPSNLSHTLNNGSTTESSAATPGLTNTATAPAKSNPRTPAAAAKTPSRLNHTDFHSITTASSNIPSTPEQRSARQKIKELELRARTLRRQIDILTSVASADLDSSSTTSTPPSSTSTSTSASTSASTKPPPLPPAPVENPPTKTRLALLTTKWRLATQLAAETVFTDVSARIKDSGGMSAYRRSQRERARESQAWFAGADEPEKIDNEAAEVDSREEERSLVERYGRVARGEGAVREEEEAQREREDEEEEEEEFGMEEMCKMLGIETEVVGWDCKGQRWVT